MKLLDNRIIPYLYKPIYFPNEKKLDYGIMGILKFLKNMI